MIAQVLVACLLFLPLLRGIAAIRLIEIVICHRCRGQVVCGLVLQVMVN